MESLPHRAAVPSTSNGDVPEKPLGSPSVGSVDSVENPIQPTPDVEGFAFGDNGGGASLVPLPVTKTGLMASLDQIEAGALDTIDLAVSVLVGVRRVREGLA